LKPNEETNNANALSCANCGKEILDKESDFCAYCGVRFDSKPKSPDLTTGAGILAIMAATFSIIVGVFGIRYYQLYVSYFASYGADSSGSIGFLLFLSFAFVSSGFGFAGGMLALAKKRFHLSVFGIVLMLCSALFTFVALWLYEYGYPDIILLSGISVITFSVASALFVGRSKSKFF
jgi:DNA-directed RNA polymerase subunit RPC12/RpoP